MKYFALIFVFLIGFFITIPCGDRISAYSVKQNTEQATHQEKKEKHSDSCSPFCSCACCGLQSVAATFHVLEIQEAFASISKEITTYHNSSDLGIIYGIWQPPKI